MTLGLRSLRRSPEHPALALHRAKRPQMRGLQNRFGLFRSDEVRIPHLRLGSQDPLSEGITGVRRAFQTVGGGSAQVNETQRTTDLVAAVSDAATTGLAIEHIAAEEEAGRGPSTFDEATTEALKLLTQLKRDEAPGRRQRLPGRDPGNQRVCRVLAGNWWADVATEATSASEMEVTSGRKERRR